MVKDDNNLCDIEDDTQERRRRRTVLDLAEANMVADLCNEIKRHARAIRQERKLREELFSEVELRRDRERIRSEMEHRTKETSFRPIRRGSTPHAANYSPIASRSSSTMSPIQNRTTTTTTQHSQPRTSTPLPRARSEERSQIIRSIMTDKTARSTTTTPASTSGETPSPRTRTTDSPADCPR